MFPNFLQITVPLAKISLWLSHFSKLLIAFWTELNILLYMEFLTLYTEGSSIIGLSEQCMHNYILGLFIVSQMSWDESLCQCQKPLEVEKAEACITLAAILFY